MKSPTSTNYQKHRRTLFKSTLKETAVQWAKMLDTPTYQQLRNLFLGKNWSIESQRQIITGVLSEYYVAALDVSMEAYFLKWAIHANNLEEPRNDECIIDHRRWQFSLRVNDRLELLKTQGT